MHSGPGVDERRRAVVDRSWLWCRQVHGAGVLVAGAEDTAVGAEADAWVARTRAGGAGGSPPTDAALAIFTADCAPLALASPEGVMAAVHAGWMGLRAGVVGAAVQAMRVLGAETISAVLGPCIHPECYEFSPDDLSGLVSQFGPEVASVTSEGAPALDLPQAVRSALADAGVGDLTDLAVCTGCSADHWSHRARRDPQRQALVVWRR